MSGGKHTPGPWHLGEVENGDTGLPDPDLAFVYGGLADELEINIGTADGSAFANARLIAAAPELLDVARMALAVAEMELGSAEAPTFSPRDMMDAARAAIAKAEGRP